MNFVVINLFITFLLSNPLSIITGDLPPSSSVKEDRCLDEACTTFFPINVLPVKKYMIKG